jgi:hypothetical protein
MPSRENSERRTGSRRLVLFFAGLVLFDLLIWTAVVLTR